MFFHQILRPSIFFIIASLYIQAPAQTGLLGSATPYPDSLPAYTLPDSLTPVMINHVGRHGARYPSGPSHTATIRKYLSDKPLTPLGRQLLNVADSVDRTTNGRWGQLDSLGMAEQADIARRMIHRFRPIFTDSVKIQAISSYVPRCVMSMYAFLHQVSVTCQSSEINAASGPQFTPLMRFFSISDIYKKWADSIDMESILTQLPQFAIADNSISRLTTGASLGSEGKRLKFLLAEYATLSIQGASGGRQDIWQNFLSPEEMQALWAINDVKQHLLHSSSAQSQIPTAIAAPLLSNIISTFDAFIKNPDRISPVQLRFGHAETIMPLAALMLLPGCVYTGKNDEVPDHWHNYDIVPMAANIQMILLRSDTGNYYVLTLLNEHPTSLPGFGLYAPWPRLREYLAQKI